MSGNKWGLALLLSSGLVLAACNASDDKGDAGVTKKERATTTREETKDNLPKGATTPSSTPQDVYRATELEKKNTAPMSSKVEYKADAGKISAGNQGRVCAEEAAQDVDCRGKVAAKCCVAPMPAGYLSSYPSAACISTDTEHYGQVIENPFIQAALEPLSTFSTDVDTAAYSNARRFLTQQHSLPPKDAVRIEDFVNYFQYAYPAPAEGKPFSVTSEIATCPWNGDHWLLKIGLKGREIAKEKRGASNLVFLLDVSGSMSDENKLPLVKKGMRMLTDGLGEDDKVSMVVYAGSSGLVLPATRGDKKDVIKAALDKLSAGGSTNGGEGLELAYRTAMENYVKGGINRVILCTDGDFNTGPVTGDGDVTRLVQEKSKSGVFLTILGFGCGNLKDAKLVQAADKGNGFYAYVDGEREARRVFCEQLNGTLITIAKDVKIQVDFNSGKVGAYRLLGYEKRLLRKEDFKDDTKDAGEIGAGHTVTVFYELVPTGRTIPNGVDGSEFSKTVMVTPEAVKPEALKADAPAAIVRLRWKTPEGNESEEARYPAPATAVSIQQASVDFRFATSAALFAMLLRDSSYAQGATWQQAADLAEQNKGQDIGNYRSEMTEMLRKAAVLKGQGAVRPMPGVICR